MQKRFVTAPFQLLFSQYSFIQQESVGAVGAEGQSVRVRFHREEIIRFRLRRDGDIERVIRPQIRIAHVAGDAGQNVERAGFIPREIFDMSAIAVRVKMRGEDEIGARFFDDGHESRAFFRKSFLPLRPRGNAVLQRISVHEDDAPRFL